MVTLVGSEIVVNAASDTREQSSPEIAALSGGGFVVAWDDQTGSTPTDDVRSQRFDSSGNKVGSEAFFPVDLSAAVGNSLAVAGVSGGGYAVSWSDYFAVNAQLYDSSGTASGSPITVSATNGTGPDLGPLASGGFVDVWTVPSGGIWGAV
jgi:hypothetical protein